MEEDQRWSWIFSFVLEHFHDNQSLFHPVIQGQRESPGGLPALLNPESLFFYQGRKAISLMIFLWLRLVQHQYHRSLTLGIMIIIRS